MKRVYRKTALRRVPAGLLLVGCLLFVASQTEVFGQAATFAGNAQHTSIYGPASQNLNQIRWTTPIDLNNTGALAHYGSPLISGNNTVFVPVKTSNDGFRVDVFSGANGGFKFSAATDYVMPAHNWIPSYNPAIATGGLGTRLYFAGAGGTIWHIDNADSSTPGAPVRDVFYTTLANYNANAALFNSTVFIDTPITPAADGSIYFGFRVQGSAPSPLNTTQSGYAKISAAGAGSSVLAGTASGDPQIILDSHNVAPAISNDGTTFYVVVKWANDRNYCYLLGLDTATLATKYSVFLRDPRNASPAGVTDDGTASPMVAPDGDVYFGVLGNPSNNGSRGFLLHFSADLSVTKTPGGFGWDYTAGVVPSTMIPTYTGSSPYLLFCKYNDYAFQDGSGVNRVAILDPNAVQTDPHASAVGLTEMREVMTVIGPTPDFENPGIPNAVREWCINTPAVNPATNSVFFDSEDGRLYRWNLATNALDQAVSLTQGFGEPYVPTVMGPDGGVYTLNGGTLFSLGEKSEVAVSMNSSSPAVDSAVVGNPITFTVSVSGGAGTPAGSVTFTDVTYDNAGPITNTIAANVPLDSSGQASVTTPTLSAAPNRGNHFITASYGGDANHQPATATFMQKIHLNGTATSVAFSQNPAPVNAAISITARVSGLPSGAGTPSGMVTFFDGDQVIGQAALSASGEVSISKSNFVYGSHQIVARYDSDTQFAASRGGAVLKINPGAPPVLQFSTATATASEGAGALTVQVTRSGDLSGISRAEFTTSDRAGNNDCGEVNGIASSRCDYSATAGRLTFNPGEASKSITIPIVDDNRVEGDETFTITLSNPDAGVLGANSIGTLTITDNDSSAATFNPIDDPQFFVHQHYLDLLNRLPDAGGFSYWTNQLTGNATNDPPPCPSGDAQCVTTRRTNISDAFFFELEFQQTGAYVYRLYRAAYGNNQPFSNPNVDPRFPGEDLKIPAFANFEQDRSTVPGGPDLVTEQTDLANSFVSRPEFLARYPATLSTADQFVDAILTTLNSINVDLSSERAKLITEFNQNGRGGVMFRLANDDVANNNVNNRGFIDAEYNREFVYAEYGGYLRRDSDINGFLFWLGQVNNAPLRDTSKQHALVCSFITSLEYQLRFSAVTPHNNRDCPQ